MLQFETPSGTRFWNLDSKLAAPTVRLRCMRLGFLACHYRCVDLTNRSGPVSQAFDSEDATRALLAEILDADGTVMRVCAKPGHHGLPAPAAS